MAIKSTIKRLYPNYANLDWSNQQSWVKQDRDMKRSVIGTLDKDTKEKLTEFIKNNPEYGERLNLSVESYGLTVVDKERPTEIFSTMGCRTVNGANCRYDQDYFKSQLMSLIDDENPTISLEQLDKDITSMVQKDGRGNISPTTIILPTIAMETKDRLGDAAKNEEFLIEEFFKDLEKTIYLAKDGLIERYNHIISQDIRAAQFVCDNNSFAGYKYGKGIESYMQHGTLVIGQLGLAETLQILIGENQSTDKGMKLAKRIEQLYLDKCNEFKKKYHLNFGVYYTPAENTAYTAMLKFQKKYGKIPNISDRDYFTNSMHLPVWEKVDPFRKIDIESQLTGYSNAGCITYVEVGDTCMHNEKAIEEIVDYAMDHDIPYFAINLPNDTCESCGYQGEIKEGDSCPVCGEQYKISRLRRVTGYLTADYKKAFNLGKQAEVRDRVKHTDYMKVDL